MNQAKAREFYNSLDPQQKHFVDKKTISTTLSVKHWMAFLGKAASFDEMNNKLRAGYKSKIGYIVLAIFFAAFGSFFIMAFVPMAIYLIIPLIVIAIIYGVYEFRRYRYLSAKDISDYLPRFFIPFLEAMRIKAGESAKLSAALDFRNPQKVLTPEKYTDQTTIKRKVKLFEPKIFLGKITLLDGVYLETALVDEIRVFSYWKRGSSGKMKHKSKTKTTHNYFIKLTIPRESYSLNQNVKRNPSIEIVEEGSEITLKYKGKFKSMNVGVLPVNNYFAALHELYNQLTSTSSTAAAETGDFTTETTTSTPMVSNIPAMVWAGTYFSDYDYDSTRYRSDPNLVVNDDMDSTNLFDS